MAMDPKAMAPLLASLLRASLVAAAILAAYNIRLFAVANYGPVIHEFDPWFNFRATEYMVANGWQAFQAWFDHEVWYPLGRHVGSTTFPGLQLTASFIYHALQSIGMGMSLNDVCVYIPAWFGCVAACFTGLLTLEVTNKPNAAVAATCIMAILPAHLMRSVAGGYDNESIAISAIVMTFYLWVRSLRTDSSWPFAILCGLSYVYMVAAWGGYVFVLNMIGVHAAVLIGLGRFSERLWRAYSIWFVVGTCGAVFGPARYLVGWQPFQSLEQLGPTAVFGGIQLWYLSEVLAKQRGLSTVDAFVLKAKIFGAAALVAAVLVMFVLPDGFIGPLSARVVGVLLEDLLCDGFSVVVRHAHWAALLFNWHFDLLRSQVH